MKDVPSFHESSLSFINEMMYDMSKPISQYFRQNFIDTPYEGYRSIIINGLGVMNLGDEGYEGSIASFGESSIDVELIQESAYIRFQNFPKLLDEVEIQAIRTRAFISPTSPHCCFDFHFRESGDKAFILTLVKERELNPIQSWPIIDFLCIGFQNWALRSGQF